MQRERYTLKHATSTSIEVTVLTYGATISSVKAPDRRGSLGECVLGFDEETSYAATWPRRDATCPYFGCAAGRVANRVANAAFSLDGKDYKVKANNGAHHLHGGGVGFDKKRWAVVEATDTALTLALRSPDGEEGYPGCVDARITYSLPTPTSLKIEYAATTDAATPLNLTNHSYWNLEDGGATDVLGHVVRVNADLYTPADDESIPTGEIRKCAGAMDLSKPKALGDNIYDTDQGKGYDHNYVLRETPGADGLRTVATAWAPKSGRVMRVRSTEPGVQVYTGNYLDGSLRRRDGGPAYARHAGVCFECQKFPDAVHQAHFPSIILRPGETYAQTTVHDFGTAASNAAAFGEE